MKTSPELAEALTHLRGNRDFQTVLKSMLEHEQEATHRCVEGEGSVQLRAAGTAQALRWWREAYNSAPIDLEKFKNIRGTK